MTEISLRLIRQTHEGFFPDEIEALKEINLSNRGIQNIDNLELFTHITVLNLSGNYISRIENLEFLNNLEFLDLSGNQITGESLISSIDLLPLGLKNINLSGNPCAGDDRSLCALQDRYLELNIIVGIYEGEEEEGEHGQKFAAATAATRETDDEDGDEEEEDELPAVDEEEMESPLNADEVLRSLVDRKCRLQSVETFNMDRAVESLNGECRKAVEESTANFEARRAAKQANNKAGAENIFSIKPKVDALLKRNLDARADANEFRDRLRKAADAALNAIKTSTS